MTLVIYKSQFTCLPIKQGTEDSSCFNLGGEGQILGADFAFNYCKKRYYYGKSR
jgi:hypothetical protein